MKHIKEPFLLDVTDEACDRNPGFIELQDATRKIIALIPMSDGYYEVANAILDRCNALAGIEDPAKFVAEAKARIEEELEFNKAAEVFSNDDAKVDEYLRANGLDPNVIGEQGAIFVQTLVGKLKAEERVKKLEAALKSCLTEFGPSLSFDESKWPACVNQAQEALKP